MGADCHTATRLLYTDARGFYSFSYTYSGTNPLLVRKRDTPIPPGCPPHRSQGI